MAVIAKPYVMTISTAEGAPNRRHKSFPLTIQQYEAILMLLTDDKLPMNGFVDNRGDRKGR